MTGNWRDEILKEFTPGVARLTLVADQDGLVLEEGVSEVIRQRGFEVVPFEDHVVFRFEYESRFRSKWDSGKQTDLVVVLRSQDSDLRTLPYDLVQAGRKLSVSLGDLFPNLSYPVLSSLDRGDLDALYVAQKRHAPGQLGDNATKEFVLRHVFEIAPELVKQPSDLLRVLLRRHYRGQQMPKILDDRLIQILRQNETFARWPLEVIIPDRETFLSFLQERWPLFLNRLAAPGGPTEQEEDETNGLKFAGPSDLPFDHNDVRVYVDNLFLDGLLHPVPHEQASGIAKTWAVIGVQIDPKEDRRRRLAGLIESVRNAIPAGDARYTDWLLFSHIWAELNALVHQDAAGVGNSREIEELQVRVDSAFTPWLMRRYAGLVNLPPVPPAMLHHLPRFLARHIVEESGGKAALLVVDGLALDQWVTVREELASQRPTLRFREGAVFAWIPTLTSVSRQAIFAGKPPLFFASSIQTTEKEPLLWTQFWADHGLMPGEVAYARGLGDGSWADIEEAVFHPKVKMAGLVIDTIDKIMHGMQLGATGMHNQVRQWAQQGYLTSLLDSLLERKYRVFLTSDHGNIEADGCGNPAEGVIADVRGVRVRIYPDQVLRAETNKRFAEAMAWASVGLPSDFLPLIAPNRKAFLREHDRAVSHGGISLEEVIVPFVQIERETA